MTSSLRRGLAAVAMLLVPSVLVVASEFDVSVQPTITVDPENDTIVMYDDDLTTNSQMVVDAYFSEVFPVVKAVRTSDQSPGVIDFDATAEEDIDGMHTPGTDGTKLYAPKDGYYQILAGAELRDGSQTVYSGVVRKNGTTVVAEDLHVGQETGAYRSVQVVGSIQLEADDYLEFEVAVTGSGVTVKSINDVTPYFQIMRISD